MPPDETPDAQDANGTGEGQAAAADEKPAAVAVAGKDENGEETEDWVIAEGLEDGAPGEGTKPAPASTPISYLDLLRTPDGQKAIELYNRIQGANKEQDEARAARDAEMKSLLDKARGDDPDEAMKAKLELADRTIQEGERGSQIDSLKDEAETDFWSGIWGGMFSRPDIPQLTEDELTTIMSPSEDMAVPDYLWHVINTLASARQRAMGGEAAAAREEATANKNGELAAKHGQVKTGEGEKQKVEARQRLEPPGPAQPGTGITPIAPGEKIDMSKQYDSLTEYVRSK